MISCAFVFAAMIVLGDAERTPKNLARKLMMGNYVGTGRWTCLGTFLKAICDQLQRRGTRLRALKSLSLLKGAA